MSTQFMSIYNLSMIGWRSLSSGLKEMKICFWWKKWKHRGHFHQRKKLEDQLGYCNATFKFVIQCELYFICRMSCSEGLLFFFPINIPPNKHECVFVYLQSLTIFTTSMKHNLLQLYSCMKHLLLRYIIRNAKELIIKLNSSIWILVDFHNFLITSIYFNTNLIISLYVTIQSVQFLFRTERWTRDRIR